MLKTALLLNAVDPRVGGVLVRGEKGTAKSTAVRALAAVLPPLDVNEGCRFSCDPSDPGSWCTECRDRRDAGPAREDPAARLGWWNCRSRPLKTASSARSTSSTHSSTARGLRARPAGDGEPRDSLRRRGQSARRPPRRHAPRRGRDGRQHRRARGRLVHSSGAIHPRRHDESRRGGARPQLLDRFGLCVDVKSVREPESTG